MNEIAIIIAAGIVLAFGSVPLISMILQEIKDRRSGYNFGYGGWAIMALYAGFYFSMLVLYIGAVCST